MEDNERGNKQEIANKSTSENITNKEEKTEYTEKFDTELTAFPGEIMYFADVKIDQKIVGRKITVFAKPENIKIIKVQIIRLIYDSGTRCVILCGKDSNGKKHQCAQEYFFESQKKAEEAVEKLCKAFETSDTYNIYDVFDEEIQINYRYMLEFFLEPYDIILTPKYHFTVEEIQMKLDISGEIEFSFEPTSEHIYIKNKKIVNYEQYGNFAIEKL